MKKLLLIILCAVTLLSCGDRPTEAEVDALQSEIQNLRTTNATLLENVGDLTSLSAKDVEILEQSLESMKEKDLEIKALNAALTRNDSITIALVTSIKSSLGNVNDEDISVNVEKGVVYISISDKLLFTTGSDRINENAYSILGKVGNILNDKSTLDLMIEGHTDDQPISNSRFNDNWELSTARAVAVTRFLQDKEQIDPARMTAAGRSFYDPVASNDTAEGRAKNRRTRIVILPKLDEFHDIIASGMEQATKNDMEFKD